MKEKQVWPGIGAWAHRGCWRLTSDQVEGHLLGTEWLLSVYGSKIKPQGLCSHIPEQAYSLTLQGRIFLYILGHLSLLVNCTVITWLVIHFLFCFFLFSVSPNCFVFLTCKISKKLSPLASSSSAFSVSLPCEKLKKQPVLIVTL
jgi:hypothetical protein